MADLKESLDKLDAFVGKEDMDRYTEVCRKMDAMLGNWRQQAARAAREHAPYGEWCRDPTICADKGYCPRDPTCGD